MQAASPALRSVPVSMLAGTDVAHGEAELPGRAWRKVGDRHWQQVLELMRVQVEAEEKREAEKRALRQQIAAEQRRELDKRNAALIKEKVEAARREATEQVSEQFNELIEKQQREIEVLKVERTAAMRKADMYKARVDEKKK